jgi:hypothetical protein
MTTMNTLKTLSLSLAAALTASAAFGQAVKLDPAFPAYKATQGVSGAIKSAARTR